MQNSNLEVSCNLEASPPSLIFSSCPMHIATDHVTEVG